MAVTFGLSLSVSWICCLLIGGIMCFTLQDNAYGHPAYTEPESTGSQASVVSGPNAKANGRNTPASVTLCRNASAEATGPRASAEATGPRASAKATGPPRLSRSDRPPRLSRSDRPPRLSRSDRPPRLSRSDRPPRLSRSDRP
eukprot:XP_014061593.1 PREDICTED: putative uncharacterized protein ENSP00000383309 [Salmo salar]